MLAITRNDGYSLAINTATGANEMTYAEFKTAYNDAFTRMVGYKIGECGSDFYAGKLAELADAYPEIEAAMEAELEAA